MAVRDRRMAVGFSQEKLAEAAGLHPTYMSMVERGVAIRHLMSPVGLRALKSVPQLLEQTQSQRSIGKRKKNW